MIPTPVRGARAIWTGTARRDNCVPVTSLHALFLFLRRERVQHACCARCRGRAPATTTTTTGGGGDERTRRVPRFGVAHSNEEKSKSSVSQTLTSSLLRAGCSGDAFPED